MRRALRAYGIDIALWCIAAAAIATIWLDRAALVAAVVLVALLPAVVATARQREIRRLRRAARDTAAAHLAAEQADAVTRAAELYTLRESLTAGVNAAIVEVVAATQAVVRAAWVDDILMRLNAADEKAHAVLTTIERISLPAPRKPESGSTPSSAH